MQLSECSIVLVQKVNAHRTKLQFVDVPSLDFLVRKNIIKWGDEWVPEEGLVVGDAFPKSISFKNKISITNAFEKLIIKKDLGENQELDLLQKLAKKIVEKVDGVEYAGIGINFLSVMPCENPSRQIIDSFLKHIPNVPFDKMVGGSFSYVYPLDESTVTVEISPVKRMDGVEAVSMSSNYHLGVEYVKKIQGWIDNISVLHQDFSSQTQKLFGTTHA